ncbi:DUF6409 family protein [Streptomyces cavernae]|uniref:DUF6409 family protein n=1 Tax=Streptomyces cavernae TaxID=2259034 RepID=UPI00192E4C20|nr:DUF6409 family protein [Streptomyces cavernae]
MTATATTSETLAPGTVVRAPRYQEGKSTGIRRGIVLRTFADSGDPKSGYLVWFYTLGAAHQDGRGDNCAVSLAFPREITHLGTVEDMSERTLLKLGQGLRDWPGTRSTARTSTSADSARPDASQPCPGTRPAGARHPDPNRPLVLGEPMATTATTADDTRDWGIIAVTSQLFHYGSQQAAEEWADDLLHLTVVSRVPDGEWEPLHKTDVPVDLDALSDKQLAALQFEAARILARRHGRAL